MAIRVFDTYHASEEEIEGIKTTLNNANIPFYETHKGKWGIGSGGIWINDEDHYARARMEIRIFEQEWKAEIQKQAPSKRINWYSVPLAIFVIAMVIYLNFAWLY